MPRVFTITSKKEDIAPSMIALEWRTGASTSRFDGISSTQLRFNSFQGGALDRACNEGDWVAKEISLAIKFNLNIVVLKEEGFAYHSTLPNELVSLPYYQNYEFTRDELGKVLKAIETKFLRRENQFTLNDPLEDEPIRIGGEYISLYQDNDHGKLVVRKARAQIRLVGSHIHGTTTFGSRKKWKLHGKVYKGKRISGICYAKSLLDDGFGTFFLEVKSPSILEGY